MKIVNAYCHVGECRIHEVSVSDSEIIDCLNAQRVSATILQPFPAPPNPALVHDRIAELGAKHPGRIYGVANVNPHIHRDRYHREIERCVRELGFVGVALDTFGHAVNPNGQDARTVFEVARELRIPIVVETGWGLPFGLPSALLPRAREYSDVKIVLARAGIGQYGYEAYLVAREAPNVYVETSWFRGDDIRWLVNELGATRILLGCDLVSNLETELAKYRSLGLFQFQQFNILGQTAIDVFSLVGVTELAEPVSEPEPLTITTAPPEAAESPADAVANPSTATDGATTEEAATEPETHLEVPASSGS